jgi:membrane-bound serine protease (ClpP class)
LTVARPVGRAAARTLAVLWTSVIALSLPVVPATADGGGLAYSVAVTEVDLGAENALQRSIEDARRRKAAVFIIRLDTPGGLGESMRTMVKTIAAAPMPVVVYVHPSGARADSAGALLALAADVAAMTPQTNIGSATPVWAGPPARSRSEDQLQQDMRRKALNASVAFARSLAEEHGRNADLAERMVRTADNLSALQAHRKGLIDVLAPTEQALLRSLDGFTVKGRKAERLQTSGLELKRFDDAAVAVDGSDAYGDSSFLRSFAQFVGGAAVLGLMLVAFARARPPWRRWRRKRRRLKLQQRRSSATSDHGR